MAAFSEVYRQYEPKVYGFLLALCRDSGLAEELTQETFYQALLHIDKFEGRCSLFTWLCQIGKNAYFQECRRRKRFTGQEHYPEEPDGGPDPAELLVRTEQIRRLHRCLEQLPEPYRGVLALKMYGELRYGEIGALYNKSENWARVTGYRAKEKLIRAMKEEDEV